MSDEDNRYRGISQDELCRQLNVEITIDDLSGYQKEAATLSERARKTHPGQYNLDYGGDEIQLLDIFAPEDADNLPVLIDIHGGGWRAGSKNIRSLAAPAINDAGVLWVPIDYGLAPDYTIDQIVEHARAAVAWVYRNITAYGGDPENIYVSGNSAGGHLTGALLMPGWHQNHGLSEQVIKGACAMSGVFDLQALVHAGPGHNDDLRMDLATARGHSPLFHLPDSGCPLIRAVGEPEPDEFRLQSRIFFEAWTSRGLPAQEIIVPDAHHFAMSRQLSLPESAVFEAVREMILGTPTP